MYYHASQVANLKELLPHISNHEKPLVYLSSKRENVLVYLSNAVEKHCKEIGFEHSGSNRKWGSYGFENGILGKCDDLWKTVADFYDRERLVISGIDGNEKV